MKRLMFGLLITLSSASIVSCAKEEQAKEEVVVPKTAQPVVSPDETNFPRLIDFFAIVYALEKYKLKYQAYPISSDEGRGWDGLYSRFGESRHDWIPGLVPEFLSELPRDPRMTKSPSEQYLYKSDGANYKLLAHSADDCLEVLKIFPNLVDPRRNCRAYGYWTPRGATW